MRIDPKWYFNWKQTVFVLCPLCKKTWKNVGNFWNGFESIRVNSSLKNNSDMVTLWHFQDMLPGANFFLISRHFPRFPHFPRLPQLGHKLNQRYSKGVLILLDENGQTENLVGYIYVGGVLLAATFGYEVMLMIYIQHCTAQHSTAQLGLVEDTGCREPLAVVVPNKVTILELLYECSGVAGAFLDQRTVCIFRTRRSVGQWYHQIGRAQELHGGWMGRRVEWNVPARRLNHGHEEACISLSCLGGVIWESRCRNTIHQHSRWSFLRSHRTGRSMDARSVSCRALLASFLFHRSQSNITICFRLVSFVLFLIGSFPFNRQVYAHAKQIL